MMPKKDIFAEFEKKFKEVVGRDLNSKSDARMLLMSIMRARENTIESRKRALIDYLITYEGLTEDKAKVIADYTASLLQ